MLAGRVPGPLVQIVTHGPRIPGSRRSRCRMLGEDHEPRPETTWSRGVACGRPCKGRIEFDNVSFRYSAERRAGARRRVVRHRRRVGLRHRRPQRLRQDDGHPAYPGAVPDPAGLVRIDGYDCREIDLVPSAQAASAWCCRRISCSAARAREPFRGQAGCDDGGDRSRRPPGRRRGVHRTAAAWLRHADSKRRAPTCPAARRSAWRSRALCCANPRCSSSMRRPARSIRTARRSSAEPCARSPRAAPSSSSRIGFPRWSTPTRSWCSSAARSPISARHRPARCRAA